MKASELRIGNIVKIGWQNLECKIQEIKEKSVRVLYYRDDVKREHSSIIEIERLIPTELTEDFVIDLGLKPVEIENGEWYYQDNKFLLNKNYSGFYYSRNLDVKYVHQLQNLYFALTGEELTIKEEKK